MVPIKEMTDVLRVIKETTNLKPKAWVRLKRGVYKDDLAQVSCFLQVPKNSANKIFILLIVDKRYLSLLNTVQDVEFLFCECRLITLSRLRMLCT